MAEYIERDELLKFKADVYDEVGHILYAVPTGRIVAMPAADVAPVVHAHWEDKGWAGMICSNCGENAIEGHYDYQVLSKYCPYCGAKMDESEDKNEIF